MSKMTWRAVFEDFKRRHPNLSKMALRYVPYDYAEILIYLNNGSEAIYNYDASRVRFTRKAQAVL